MSDTARRFIHSEGFLSKKDILYCPACGDECMHHGDVTIYDRNEDAPLTNVITVHNLSVSSKLISSEIPATEGGNPSPRRGAIAIEFHCENCDRTNRLAIIQHKGNTYFEWI